MKIKEFIEKAIEGGWTNWVPKQSFEVPNWENKPWVADVFLDPEAWEAVGKVEGWKDREELGFIDRDKTMVGIDPRVEWVEKMHSMIDALIEGKSLEDYIKSL